MSCTLIPRTSLLPCVWTLQFINILPVLVNPKLVSKLQMCWAEGHSRSLQGLAVLRASRFSRHAVIFCCWVLYCQAVLESTCLLLLEETEDSGDRGVCFCTVAWDWLRALIICCTYIESPAQSYSCTRLYCWPNSCIPSYRPTRGLILVLEILWASIICLTYFLRPCVWKHSLKAFYYSTLPSFLSTFLQSLTGVYVQNRVQEVLLTSTCSDWFQKDGAGLALQMFLDLIRKGCGEEIAAPTFLCFPLVLAAVVWNILFLQAARFDWPLLYRHNGTAHWSLLPAFSWADLPWRATTCGCGALQAVVQSTLC